MKPSPTIPAPGVRDPARHTTARGILAGALLCACALASAQDDADRVRGDDDQCPDTPADVAVDPTGCEYDADRDGVVDRLDACPGTTPGAPVSMRGCEHDADADGVADYRDRCPATPAGTRITARGCPLTDTLVLDGVVFQSGSARFEDRSLPALEDAAATLSAYPELDVEIAGHTDSRGEAAENLALSRERAEAVADYLVRRGVARQRLSARGYGETQPVADNDSAAGRARNRRVEIRIR